MMNNECILVLQTSSISTFDVYQNFFFAIRIVLILAFFESYEHFDKKLFWNNSLENWSYPGLKKPPRTQNDGSFFYKLY